MYMIIIDVEGVEDDGQHMYINTYLTKLRSTPISSKPYGDFVKDLDLMTVRICNRIGKSVGWTMT